jgi:hypothetical protein
VVKYRFRARTARRVAIAFPSVRHFLTRYCESFNGKLRDEFLNEEIFYSLKEAQILTERGIQHGAAALGYRPPAPAACSPPVPTSSLSQPTLTTLGTKTRSGHSARGRRSDPEAPRWRHCEATVEARL